MSAKLPLIDRYIITQLIPPFCFALVTFATVAELIGISFEQIRFIINRGLPISLSVYLHLLKAPAFIAIVFPFAVLFAAIYTYTNLAKNSEIIALQSFGVSLYRLVAPGIALSLLVAAVMFVFNELVVPPANYQAAIAIEQAMNIDRAKLAKYHKQQIIYPELKNQELQYLFYADRFDGQKMIEVTLVIFHQQRLKQIIRSQSAQWNEFTQLWQFYQGTKSTLKKDGSYDEIGNFEELSLNIPKNLLDYANHDRDNREMNIFQSYQRLGIIKKTGNTKKIRQLKVSIQEKEAKPFACSVFVLVGAALGINSSSRSRGSAFGITVIVIFAYYMLGFITVSLGMAGVIPVFWAVWFPNLLGAAVGCALLLYQS